MKRKADERRQTEWNRSFSDLMPLWADLNGAATVIIILITIDRIERGDQLTYVPPVWPGHTSCPPSES